MYCSVMRRKGNRFAGRYALVPLAFGSLLLPLSATADADTTRLETVEVIGTATPAYKPQSAVIGPLGEQALIDTPYAINVIPADLLENQQLKSVREAFRYLPSVQGENIRPQTRGLQAGVVQNTRIDGMNIAATTDYPIEQFDRIEVLNGLSAALYGPANPAGTFNYVLKRPTATPLRRFGLGYTSQGQSSVSADISDRFGDDQRFGVRLNLLNEGGESYVDRSSLDRRLISLAFDANLTPDTKLETNFSRYHYTSRGLPGTFAVATGVRFPDAPNPKTVGYGQPFAGDDNVTTTYSARIKHRFDENWNLTAGILKQSSDRTSTVPTNTLTNNAGAYRVNVATTTFTLDEIVSHMVSLNGAIQTGSIRHDLVVSATGFDWDRYTPFNPPPTGGYQIGTSNLSNPAIFSQPALPDFKNRYKSQSTRQQSLTLGDTATFNERWSAGLFVSQSWINQSGKNASGASVASRSYDEDGISTNATVSYKPQKNMTIYGSFANSLQQGESNSTGTTILPPYRSKQWELGYKTELGQMGLGAALFRIERPYAYTVAGIFATRGEQRNHGIELTANGTLTKNLSVYGGLTYLDATLHKTGNAATEGKDVMGLPKWMANTLFDYRIADVPGLAVNLNIQHMGSRYGDHANTYQVDGYTIADVGVRYSTQLWKRATTWRLTISNVSDKRYWANITPAGQNGYTADGVGNGTLGTPRMIRLSMQMDF